MAKKNTLKKDRRDFLKLASLGSLAGGATLVVGNQAKAQDPSEHDNKGYRESDHVNTYYKLSRF